ncbi:ComEC/Rec2 family competence protein [Clostridium sp. UBA1652]|uniref:ComEC/Rec2 family competence protein n=1 Tax=Clostridium sp. UBA1652 TaxID=1946348 RepID=UPI00258083AF|nr:MBL fold metallo-hydrolase [Clostridium sp. UBA1652]
MKKKHISLIFIIWLLIFLTCRFSFINLKVSATEKKPEVHFIDVGQSDCALIKNGDENYLIDSGDKTESSKVIKYLKDQGVEKLDFIILTHYHGDHYGGLYDITKNIKTDIVYVPKFYVVEEERVKAIKSLIDTNTSFGIIEKGWTYKKDGLSLKVLLPSKPHKSLENNDSLVIRGDINKNSYLFMADCEFDEEKELLDMKEIENIDVLKLGHHGLDTSSSEEFLKKVNPKYTVINCDGKESPDKAVIDRLKTLETKILRTDINGNIVFTQK